MWVFGGRGGGELCGLGKPLGWPWQQLGWLAAAAAACLGTCSGIWHSTGQFFGAVAPCIRKQRGWQSSSMALTVDCPNISIMSPFLYQCVCGVNPFFSHCFQAVLWMAWLAATRAHSLIQVPEAVVVGRGLIQAASMSIGNIGEGWLKGFCTPSLLFVRFLNHLGLEVSFQAFISCDLHLLLPIFFSSFWRVLISSGQFAIRVCWHYCALFYYCCSLRHSEVVVCCWLLAAELLFLLLIVHWVFIAGAVGSRARQVITICGHRMMFWAAHRAQKTSTWSQQVGIGGMVGEVRYVVARSLAPAFWGKALVIHLGGNDLGFLQGKALIIQAKADMALIRKGWLGIKWIYLAMLSQTRAMAFFLLEL